MKFTKYVFIFVLLVSQYPLYSQQRMELLLGSGWYNHSDKYWGESCKIAIHFNGECVFNDSIISSQVVGIAKYILLPFPKEKINEIKVELNGVDIGCFYLHRFFFRKKNILRMDYAINQQLGYIQVHLVRAKDYVFL